MEVMMLKFRSKVKIGKFSEPLMMMMMMIRMMMIRMMMMMMTVVVMMMMVVMLMVPMTMMMATSNIIRISIAISSMIAVAVHTVSSSSTFRSTTASKRHQVPGGSFAQGPVPQLKFQLRS